MSPARRHRDRILAATAAAAALEGAAALDGGLPVPDTSPYEQMRMKLAMDLRRLKEIQSIERKIEAKRQMLPEYEAWIEGVLAAAAESGQGVQDEILATIMIWRIDVGDYEAALPLAEYVLRWKLALPERYARTAPTLIVEEMAGAALSRLGQGEPFPSGVLEYLELLSEGEDMPDEVRAKLHKARGVEVMPKPEAEDDTNGPAGAVRAAREDALAAFKRARQLHEKCGVTKLIEQIERALKKSALQADANSSGTNAG